MPEKKFNFKLGSDPEFSFVLQNRRVNACELIQNINKHIEGFTNTQGGYKCKGGILGWDGCNATAEFRPSPSNSITEITKNIKELITKTAETFPVFDLLVLSTFAPVGGHIHFQIPEEYHLNKKKIQILHKKISSFYLPILISENKINLRLRSASSNYGSLTDYHDDNQYGPQSDREYTYEFRTPSAEWLLTEKLCRATFAYLGTVYHEIMNNPRNFAKYMNLVFKSNEQANALHQLTISNYIGITQGIFEQIKKAVKTFEFYPQFKPEIEYILSPNKVIKDKKKTNYNLVEGWNIRKTTKTKQPTMKEIINEKKFLEKAKTINLDRMAKLMNISYNDDVNVDFFVKTLTERAMAFNWKIKNNYFLFGMKKGISDTIIFNEKKELLLGQNTIQTTSDKLAIIKLMDRIFSKFGKITNKNINPNTGEIERTKTIVIGLPYETRIKKNTKEFLEFVYKLEADKLKPETVTSCNKNLIEDDFKCDSEKGKLYKYVYNVRTEEPEIPNGVVFDENSQGARIAEQNKEIILRQEDTVERENSEEEFPMQIAPNSNMYEQTFTVGPIGYSGLTPTTDWNFENITRREQQAEVEEDNSDN
jgi:hypothetical protein